MTSEILTPVVVWEDFKIEHQPKIVKIGEYVDGDIIISRFYLYGRTVENEYVKIYCALARNSRLISMPGALVVQDFKSGANEEIIRHLANDGYAGITFDMCGDFGDKGNRTVYPFALSKVNYINCKNELTKVEGSIKDTCWYEWGVTLRYVLDYFLSLPYVNCVGVIGEDFASTVVWHLCASDDRVKCGLIIQNSGWIAYKGKFKFDTDKNISFNDEMMKYMAGIEPQTYAAHVKCPIMLLTSTNNEDFDCDRATDTVNRISNNLYTAIDYSINFKSVIDFEEIKNFKLFFDKFVKGNNKVELPQSVAISGNVENGELNVIVEPDLNNLKDVKLYVAEGIIDPSIRSWQEVDGEKIENGYKFNFKPFADSKNIMFFAKSFYKNKFSVCSEILCKKVKSEEIENKYKSNIIYSSRLPNGESKFCAWKESATGSLPINIDGNNDIIVKNGPCGINGITSTNGLLTYSVGTPRFSPKDDALFMFDVYVKDNCEFEVCIKTKNQQDVREYYAKIKLCGGNAWHNVKVKHGDFKTIEGRSLKDYSGICSLALDCKSEFLVNNILWV